MDDFKNQDLNQYKDENTGDSSKAETGSISGFDRVETSGEKSGDNNYESGYTVTPQGGFYNRSKEDIIQDTDFSAGNYSSGSEESSVCSEQTDSENKSEYSYEAGSGIYTGVNGQYPYGTPVNPKPKKEKRRYSAAVIIVSVVLSAVIAALSSAAVVLNLKDNKTVTNLPSVSSGGNSDNNSSAESSNVNITPGEDASGISSTVQAVAAKASKSVVGIRTTTSVTNFFGGSNESKGEGSGVVYTSDGYIVTNYHVISGTINQSGKTRIEVFFDNCNTDPYTASVVGYNISADLAVIKIDANNLSPADFGDSSKLAAGQYVITIGAPGGLEFMGSVTYGIISGLNRGASSDSDIGLIQTDAAINPGNSGGALLDSSGKLIGINSSKIVSEEFEGMGFAIPVNTVIEVCNNIINKKGDSEPYIGITVSEKYTSDVLDYYGFPNGAVVASVAEGSPAEDTGIKKGDIITEFNGVKITDYKVLEKTLANCKPGETVSVKIYRNGRYYTAKIKIASNNQTTGLFS